MFKGITHVYRAYTKGSSTYNYQAPQANWQKRIYWKNSSSQINLIKTTYVYRFQNSSISLSPNAPHKTIWDHVPNCYITASTKIALPS